jgi:hypothetical protein
MSTRFIFLDWGDHADLSQDLLCILQCRVAYVCVCDFLRLVLKQLLRQVGRACPFPCCFNFLHTMIEFKTFLGLSILISKPFHQILTTISSPYLYKGFPKILLTIQLRL